MTLRVTEEGEEALRRVRPGGRARAVGAREARARRDERRDGRLRAGVDRDLADRRAGQGRRGGRAGGAAGAAPGDREGSTSGLRGRAARRRLGARAGRGEVRRAEWIANAAQAHMLDRSGQRYAQARAPMGGPAPWSPARGRRSSDSASAGASESDAGTGVSGSTPSHRRRTAASKCRRHLGIGRRARARSRRARGGRCAEIGGASARRSHARTRRSTSLRASAAASPGREVAARAAGAVRGGEPTDGGASGRLPSAPTGRTGEELCEGRSAETGRVRGST